MAEFTGKQPVTDWSHGGVDVADWENIYVIGDVHECRGGLGTLPRTFDREPTELGVTTAGLVRKWGDSHRVVRLVREMDGASSVEENNESKSLWGDASLPELTATGSMEADPYE